VLTNANIDQLAFSEEEYVKNRKGLSKEEMATYNQYIRKKFGILMNKRDEKDRRFKELLRKNLGSNIKESNQDSEYSSTTSV